MLAFGLNRFTQAFAAAVSDAGGELNSKQLEATDRLAAQLFAWGGRVSLEITFSFLYPFTGGSAVSNSFNLADSSVGRIEWEGGITHDGLGIKGDGVSGVGKTGVTLAGPLASDAYVIFGVYSRTASSGNFVDISNWYTSAKGGILTYLRKIDGNAGIYMGTVGAFGAVANSQGLFTGLRDGAAGHWGYRNGVPFPSSADVNLAVDPPVPFALLGLPVADTDPQEYNASSARNLAFAFLTNKKATPGIGAIFTTPKQAELYTIVQSFQTKLGRQV